MLKLIFVLMVSFISFAAIAQEFTKEEIRHIKICKGLKKCEGSSDYGGPCYRGYGGPYYDGYGGACYAGYDGPLYNGYGGRLYAGYGGNCYKEYGGVCYDGYSGPCSVEGIANKKCPIQCRTVCER